MEYWPPGGPPRYVLLNTLLCSHDVNGMVENSTVGDLPGGPVAENLSYNAGGWDVGSIPNQGTKISHAMRQLSLHTTTVGSSICTQKAHPLLLGGSLRAAAKVPRATTLQGQNSSLTKIFSFKKEQHCPVGWSAVKTVPRVSAVHCGCHCLLVATDL